MRKISREEAIPEFILESAKHRAAALAATHLRLVKEVGEVSLEHSRRTGSIRTEWILNVSAKMSRGKDLPEVRFWIHSSELCALIDGAPARIPRAIYRKLASYTERDGQEFCFVILHENVAGTCEYVETRTERLNSSELTEPPVTPTASLNGGLFLNMNKPANKEQPE